MDHLVARGVILGGGETQGGTIVEGQDVLHRPLAEGLLADDHGPLEVLKAAGHDFGGAGAAAIDEQD